MPDIKHYFRSGKMNKDLDERLVPNGEYRDAMNVQVSTSDGDDVGAIQNIAGNTKITGKTYNSNTQAITSSWTGTSFGLTNAKCIGSVVNTENDRIYWFIKADEADCIAEYDDIKGIISPVLVDVNNILNFTNDQYITGINVVEGMLFWTDNKSEPKKIDIEVFKSGCANNFTTHTKYTGKLIAAAELSAASAFTEQHITVAKKAPMDAPTLTMSTSTRGGNGTGTSPVIVSNSTAGLFTNAQNESIAAGTNVTLTFSPSPNYQVGDILTLTAEYEELGQTVYYEIKVRIRTLSNSNQSASVKIQSIPSELPYIPLVWEVLLSEEGVLFEKKFVRFAYRWKYYSGEYSTFSPFSEIAFKPSTFEYLSTDGHNLGMINNLRQLTINITESRPIDVEEVDILYKESNNNNVYVVDTLKENSDGTFPTSYNLESEIISKTVESNQMIRPWDNVPRKAKSQEITANRLIFGNYLQNYNIPDFNLPDINMAITQSPITTVREPELSIKSLRTYQAGVVYIDKYNRQSPVFTSTNASKQTSKTYAETVNAIDITLNNQPPDWATHFKYYIKETSNEYYNLSMDRYYLAEDGNVWLSFPSSERNKVQEDMYLILKKQHDSDTFVATKARYKILDISNEVPDFIKLTTKATANGNAKCLSSNIPQIGSTSFKFLGPNPDSNPNFGSGFSSDAVIQISVAGNKTEKYNVISGGPTGDDSGTEPYKYEYSVTIDEPLKEGETMLNGLTTNSLFEVILFEEKFERKAEFYGRFFVKINRDSNFDTNIIASFPDVQAEFGITNSRAIFDNAVNTGPNDGRQEASWYDMRAKHNKISSGNNGHPVLGTNTMTFYFTASPKSRSKDFDKANTINNFLRSISTTNTLFRFKGKNTNTVGEIYKVTNCTISYAYRRNGRKRLASSKRRAYNITFEHHQNGTPYEDTFTSNGGNFSGDYIDEIQILEKVISGDNEVLTSTNPAIWETEPKEAIDLDLYYEASKSHAISDHGATHTIPFKNCYSFGNGVESNRIRDDFNAPQIDKGVKVSTVLAEQYKEERRKNGLIFSGIFNSTSGVNRLNQFIQGEAITKDLNPHYGSIQKLHARNTDLIVFCEDKVLKVLANKDALFEAGGNAQLTATNRVLGQSIPFIGEYGISLNPESFADYAYRVYFVDKARGAVLRLSRDGLTAISEHGMRDYFKDTLAASTLILGSYDDSKGLYNLTLNNQTVSFDEKVRGWPSFKSFVPEAALALNNKYYSIKNGELWVHTNQVRNTFYGGDAEDSSVTFLINEMPETIKGFKTLNYGGSRSRVYTNNYDAGNNYANPTSTSTKGWYCEYIRTNDQEGFIKEFKKKEGRYYNFIKGDATSLTNLDSQEFNVQGIGKFIGNLSGDVTPDDRVVTVTLTGVANTTSNAFTFNVTPSTEIHTTNSSIQITIIPNSGSTLTASDLSVANSATGSYVDSVSFAQSGANVIATVNFTDGVNMPNSDLNINLAVTGDGVVNVYKLNDLVIKDQTDSGVTLSSSFAGSGNATAEANINRTGFPANYSTTHVVSTVTLQLSSGKVFHEVPSFRIETEDNDPESFYTITFQDRDASNAAITIGSGGKTLEDVNKRVYTISYTFPSADTNDNAIIFHAKSKDAAVAEGNKITGYRVDGSTTINRFGTTKNVYIYGKNGAQFTFALNIDSAGNNFWDGDSFESGSTTLVIPSSGVYTIPIVFPQTSTSKTYVVTIAAVSPTTLASPLMGNIYDNSGNVQNPFTINQFADVDLTIGATSSDLTVTSSNVVKTYTALGFPVEDSSFFVADINITATATGNITKTRDPEITDFSNFNSNNFDWDFDLTSVTINNLPSTKTITIAGKAYIDRYGSTDTTTNLNLDSFTSVAGGSSGGGSVMLTPAVTGSIGGIITARLNSGSKLIPIGTSSGTNYSGTGTIFGNFYGNSENQVTLSISATSSSAWNTSNISVTRGTLTQIDPSSYDLTYTWSGQLDEQIDSASDLTFTVNVALANEP